MSQWVVLVWTDWLLLKKISMHWAWANQCQSFFKHCPLFLLVLLNVTLTTIFQVIHLVTASPWWMVILNLRLNDHLVVFFKKIIINWTPCTLYLSEFKKKAAVAQVSHLWHLWREVKALVQLHCKVKALVQLHCTFIFSFVERCLVSLYSLAFLNSA